MCILRLYGGMSDAVCVSSGCVGACLILCVWVLRLCGGMSDTMCVPSGCVGACLILCVCPQVVWGHV